MLVGDIIRQAANKCPEKTAVIFENTKISYSALNRRVNALSNALLRLKLNRGDRVGILSRNRHEYLEVYFAIAKAGLIAVPLNYRLTGSDFADILNDSSAAAVFIDRDFVDTLSEIQDRLETVKCYVGIRTREFKYNYEDLLEGQSIDEPRVSSSEADIWLISYTSGTTGQPKGAMTSHRNTVAGVTSWVIENQVATDDVCLLQVPFCFASCGTTRFHGLLRGCTNVITNFDPEEFIRTVETYHITVTSMSPAVAKAIAYHPTVRSHNLKVLRKLGITTGPTTPELWEELDSIFGPIGRPFYGLTESCMVGLTLQRHEMNDNQQKLTSVGKAYVGTEVLVVDDFGESVSFNKQQVGEIIIRGDNVVSSYWNLPSETADTFRGGWVHTGDLAVVDEDLDKYLVGRKSAMIRSAGLKVMPEEIENVLSRHAAVEQVVVIGIPHDKWGETPHAVIVLRPGKQATEKEIIGFCKENLASFKKPTSVEFVHSLPMTVSGKIKRHEVREQYWGGLESRIH